VRSYTEVQEKVKNIIKNTNNTEKIKKSVKKMRKNNDPLI